MSWHAPSVENTRCAVLWGHNPNMAAPPEMQRIAAARKKGAKLIVIDPRRIAAAKEADIHIQPRPGTDCALALGMLNVIISEGLYDRGFVENWTTGFDQLAEHVKDYTPEKVEKITWVPADSIRETARLYAKTKPACIFYGPTLEQTVSGFEAARAMNTLRAICGNLDVPGGEICISLPLVNLMRLPEKWGDLEKPPRADEFPMYSGAWGLFMGCTGIPTSYVETILSEKPYPIKMMVFSGVNPMVTFPNVTRLKQALEKLDFMVVMDLFMTPTAEMADIVLPACTFLERTDELHNTYMLYENTPYGIFASQAIEPLGESWPDWKFWIELARRMGYGEYFPWKSSEEIIDYYLEPSGLTVKQLKESPSGVPFGTIKGLDYFEQHPEELRFPTPSGKVELYCEALKEMGYDPLPVYREPAESPLSNPELSKQYPLILTTGARLLEYSDSRYRNLPKMRRRKPKPVAEIHPASAEKHGINDGEMITVESIRGVLSIKASVTEDIMPGVVRIAGVWPEGTANILTDDAPACPIMGYPELRSVLCRVKSS
jgi:anaerobic selenocysteine-containing dehydrogenase